MSRAILAAALALAAAAPRAALALPFRQTCPNGNCISWNSQSVTWKLNTNPGRVAAAAAPGCDAATVEATVKAAFQVWEDADAGAGNLALPYGGATNSINTSTSSNGEHVVVFRRGWCSDHPQAANDPCFPDGTCGSKYNCFDDPGGPLDHQTLAITGVKYVGSCIVDADLEVADWNGTGDGTDILDSTAGDVPYGWYWTCLDPATVPATCTQYGEADCVFEDLQNTLTHEAGHFIGLAHPCEFGGRGGAPVCGADDGSTMFPSAQLREKEKRSLSAEDIAGVRAIYDAGHAGSLSCPSTSTSSGCGCGGAPVGGILALLGLSALAPRLRRRR